MKRKDRRIVLLLSVLLTAAIIASAMMSLRRMNRYIEENGRRNVDTVMGQMRQSYDTQMREYYIDLQQIDDYLFPEENRSIRLEDYKTFFDARKKGAYEKLLFLKADGQVLTEEGIHSRIELRDQLLENLRQNQNVTKLISWEEDGKQELLYLVAVPCREYEVDGERFTALGALYQHSRIDSMLETSTHGANTWLFLVDAQGYVSYTNQQDSQYLRSYSLLDHMLEEGSLTPAEYDYLTANLSGDQQEVLVPRFNGRPYYFGFAPLQRSDSKLVCIVPEWAVNNVLTDYRKDVVRYSTILTVFTISICCGLLYIVFRLRESEQRVSFDAENRIMQAQAMEALEVEKSKAELANQAKNEFLSRMSHDVRTPMNAIVGTMDLIEHDAADPDKVLDYVRRVRGSCRHLLSLVNNVLDMSQMESTQMVLNRAPISLSELMGRMDSIVGVHTREKGQQFEIHVHNITHEYLLGDNGRLQQVLLNLLTNAVKFTPEGGSISLELTELESPREDRAQLLFRVCDTGCGMTADFVKRVFEPFARADSSMTGKTPGTGLGLAITRSIVDMMDGTVSVESLPGLGSTFTVSLPMEIDSNACYDISAQSVLLITGDTQLIGDVRAALQHAALRLETASTAVQAEKLIKEIRPDVILLGSFSSDRDFDNAVRWVRAHSNNCPLVFHCSRRPLPGEQRPFTSSSIDGIITGPFFFETFRALVSQARGDVGPAEEDFSLSGMRFLCAEDNPSNEEVLRALLELEGASCDIYPDGSALVKAFASVRKGEYDAILTDVQMPVMTGLEAARAIRGGRNPLGKTIPIVAMTANVFSTDVQECLAAGMSAHVPKPLDLRILKKALKPLLGRNAEGGQT